MYAIITQNDRSAWKDKTGELYHHPKRYLRLLKPGTKIIYYKGRLQEKKYKKFRLTANPYYFGIGEIGNQYIDPESTKKDYYSEIINYQAFDIPILIKDYNGQYLEEIPDSRKGNYWRDAVRIITKEVYDKILSLSNINYHIDNVETEFTTTITEGKTKKTYSTKYERNPKLRQQALDIHGYSCSICGFNFLERYGEIGRGFIHVHHVNPLSQTGEQIVDPKTDLVPVCPNCHSMIHRDKNHILTIEELKLIFNMN